MADQHIITTMGTALKASILKESTLQDFKASLRGALLRPGDDGYADARKVWNGMIDKHPALIVRCTGVADVLSAVRFARSHNLLVAVRGGGHNIAGHATCDGGLVIDLSLMKGVQVDPVRRTVRAQGGVTWGEFDHETQAFGLATTGGTDPTTGIAGLTLGGGLGWLQGKYGLTCDNLVSADVVTAEGQFLRASAVKHPDLFWGLRGGSGNFGLVTSFEYQLHPVGPLLGGMVVYPFAKAKDVLRFYRDYTRTAPDELSAAAGVLTGPDGNLAAAILVSYCGPLEAGERILKPLRDFGPPVQDAIRPMTYADVQAMLYVFQADIQNYWKADFLQGLTEETIETIISYAAAKTSPMSAVALFPVNGAASRVGQSETAFVHRKHHYQLFIISQWLDPAESDKHIQWTREFWQATHQFAGGGVYVNELGHDDGEDRIRAAYGANYNRLVALKNTYDPTNFFRLNPNIKPTV
jgi:FAD/FMN-containing dehydrogenase